MSKKQKTNKRLDKLFQDIQPEINDSGKKSKPPVKKEAVIPPPLSTPKPASKPDASTLSPAKLPASKQTGKLVLPEIITPMPDSNGGSVYAANFQVGETDWATLRLIDETGNRAWTTDEQLLIKQVTDQLSLALENARLFQETQRRAQELAVVNQVVSSVSASLDLKSTLQAITDNLVNLLSAQNVGVALMNTEKTHLIVTAESFSTFESSDSIGLEIPIQGNPSTEEV
ncbi:MAG: GAF domain-containing protein, partial [Anaerolineales bacterium]